MLKFVNNKCTLKLIFDVDSINFSFYNIANYIIKKLKEKNMRIKCYNKRRKRDLNHQFPSTISLSNINKHVLLNFYKCRNTNDKYPFFEIFSLVLQYIDRGWKGLYGSSSCFPR